MLTCTGYIGVIKYDVNLIRTAMVGAQTGGRLGKASGE